MGQHCTATKKDGDPCKAWAVTSSSPPRCSAHGGGKSPVGAPPANQNAQTHGAYSQDTAQPADLDARIRDLDRRIRRLSDYIDDQPADLDTGDYIALLNLHGQLTSRLGRLMRDRQQVSGDEDTELTQAMSAALDQLAKEWGIEL